MLPGDEIGNLHGDGGVGTDQVPSEAPAPPPGQLEIDPQHSPIVRRAPHVSQRLRMTAPLPFGSLEPGGGGVAAESVRPDGTVTMLRQLEPSQIVSQVSLSSEESAGRGGPRVPTLVPALDTRPTGSLWGSMSVTTTSRAGGGDDREEAPRFPQDRRTVDRSLSQGSPGALAAFLHSLPVQDSPREATGLRHRRLSGQPSAFSRSESLSEADSSGSGGSERFGPSPTNRSLLQVQEGALGTSEQQAAPTVQVPPELYASYLMQAANEHQGPRPAPVVEPGGGTQQAMRRMENLQALDTAMASSPLASSTPMEPSAAAADGGDQRPQGADRRLMELRRQVAQTQHEYEGRGSVDMTPPPSQPDPRRVAERGPGASGGPPRGSPVARAVHSPLATQAAVFGSSPLQSPRVATQLTGAPAPRGSATPTSRAMPALTEMEQAAMAGRENWLCPICLQYFDEPIRISQCSHTFCKICIEGVLRRVTSNHNGQSERVSSTKPVCPLCRTEFGAPDLGVDRQLLAGMRQARVRCPNDGCQASFSPLHSKRHQDECQFGVVACPQQPHGCLFNGLRRDVPNHLQSCPYERIKGLYPKIRHQMDHMTAAMRGWENALISQQQILASHSAVLRNMERRTHQNPVHHLQLVHNVFWHPHLWGFQRERWTRTFSLSCAVMCMGLAPVFLSLLVVACRSSWQGFEWVMLHWPASSPSPPFPYPIIGVDCRGGAPGRLGCVVGVSPKVNWLVLAFLLALVFVEAWDEVNWLASIPVPAMAGGGSLWASCWAIKVCVAWAVYGLGAVPLGAPLYMSLGLSLIPAAGLRVFAPQCKFVMPVIDGLGFGLAMHWASWRRLVLARALLQLVALAGINPLTKLYEQLVEMGTAVERARAGPNRRVEVFQAVCAFFTQTARGWLWALLIAVLSVGLLRVVALPVQLLTTTALLLSLIMPLHWAVSLIGACMRWAATQGAQASRESREVFWRIFCMRALLVASVFGGVMLCTF